MLRVGWQQNRRKFIAASVLSIASGLAWPLVALALSAATSAALGRDVRGATIAGALTGVGVIGVLMLRHFAYTSYVEIADLAVITLEAELITLANGSARLDHHERADYADRMDILQRELHSLISGVGALMTVATLAVSLVSTSVVLAFVNPWLLLLPLAAVPPVLCGQRATAITERAKERMATVNRKGWHLFRLATGAESAKELRVFRLQDEFRRRNRELAAEVGRTLIAAERRAIAVNAAGQVFFAVAYLLGVLFVVRQAVTGRGAVGEVVLVITLAAQVNQQVNQTLQELRNMQQIVKGFSRLRWLRALIAAQQPAAADREMPDRIRDGIELRGVRFVYPGTTSPVLRDANVLLSAGSTVAIVGENGAGKSTLVKLLCRFYDTTDGAILIDGIDIRRLPLDAWRERISAGFQDFVRYELPARQTVGVGDLPRIDDEQAVLDALDRAHAGDVMARLDDGLSTHLGKSYTEGTNLSGGQWQKLALGRAMMRETPFLLVLDEPTAALDAEAEHHLFDRYAESARRVGARTGAITLLVTHRFSTARSADLILVVDEGRIVEAGGHAELMANDALYAELYRMQESAYVDAQRD